MVHENIIFIHIPRTGGTSIESAVGRKLEKDWKHNTASLVRKKVGEEKWQNSFVFSFVRNPWDRMISLYHQPWYRNETPYTDQGLAYFIQNVKHVPWERNYFYEYLDSDGIDFIGKFENREKDLEIISQRTGIKIDPKVHEMKTKRNLDYRTYYDDHTRQLVYDLYKRDIEKYNYSF